MNEVHAWIACKEGVVHGKLDNGKSFFIKAAPEEELLVVPEKILKIDTQNIRNKPFEIISQIKI